MTIAAAPVDLLGTALVVVIVEPAEFVVVITVLLPDAGALLLPLLPLLLPLLEPELDATELVVVMVEPAELVVVRTVVDPTAVVVVKLPEAPVVGTIVAT